MNIKAHLKRVVILMREFGLDPIKGINFIRGMPSYIYDYFLLKKQSLGEDFDFGNFYPCIHDKYDKSGSAMGHYFHQDLFVARMVFTRNPSVHVDIGSRIDGFVAHVASFRKIHVFDIRPLNDSNQIPNIIFSQSDMMGTINAEYYNYCDSISCLHAIEHFGLGRYGDPINFNGHLVGLDNIFHILKSKGKLYFSVPIGTQRIEFNAHRVFSVDYLLRYFSENYCLDSFSYIDDLGHMHENASINSDNTNSNFGCEYGCGIFELTKL